MSGWAGTWKTRGISSAKRGPNVAWIEQTCPLSYGQPRACAKKAGYKIVGIWEEVASGAKLERTKREKVLAVP
jgi:hypothetical protein